MRIKRYFAKSIRDAIRKVREEQGPDAVILSNRKVQGGFEIVAAVDFDEVLLADTADAPLTSAAAKKPATVVKPPVAASRPAAPVVTQPVARQDTSRPPAAKRAAPAAKPPVAKTAPRPAVDQAVLNGMQQEIRSLRGVLEHQLAGLIWGDVARRNPQQARLLRKLLNIELSPRLCQHIVDELGQSGDEQSNWRNALGVLAHKLPTVEDDILERGGVVALVGPTGVGKTTTIAKLAARFAVRHGSRQVALVTTDNYRIGAHEQLRAYARILDVPLRIAGDRTELREILHGLSDRKLVLIDTAGMSQRDLRLTEQFSMIRGGAGNIKTFLVLSATTRQRTLNEAIQAFGRVKLGGAILTKVDEADSLGGLLSVLISHQLPVAYISDGQRVPEDLYTARAHNLVSRAVAMRNTAQSNKMMVAAG